MDEHEVTCEAPAWMLALEKKRQRTHKLAHEVGAGSPCLQCGEACPGLDLHFWRKICRNCKCKKEDHDVVDDFGFEQFEILLGSGHSKSNSKKAVLEFLEKHTGSAAAGKAKPVAFDWVPPNVSPDVAAEYMQSLPSSKLPISGSDGALYRRQQLERQLPLHDLDASHCHQLTDTEVDNLKKYLENIQNNVVGQGRISKYGIPASKSAETLQNLRTFNSIPKPFQAGFVNTSRSQASNLEHAQQSPLVDGRGTSQNLKPPSAFLSRTPSPDSQSTLVTDLPSVADRGALFGVTLSPSSKQDKGNHKPSLNGAMSVNPVVSSVGAPPTFMSKYEDVPKYHPDSSLPAKSLDRNPSPGIELNRLLVKDSIPNLVAHSGCVPGSMWVPQECSECSQKAISGKIVSDRVCSHISNSDPLPINVQIGLSSSISLPSADKVPLSSGIAYGLENQRKSCACSKGIPCEHSMSAVGADRQVASSMPYGAGLSPQTSSLLTGKDHVKLWPLSHDADLSCQEPNRKLDCSLPKDVIFKSLNPLSQHSLVISDHEALADKEQGFLSQDSNVLRSASPSSGISSSSGSPHVLALYAHNALLSPSGSDPQDRLSPHLASLALDEIPSDETNSYEGAPNHQFNMNVNQMLELNCAHCLENISPGEVVVFADRAGSNVVWHPKCFVCNTCQELLVDLVYFYNKGHVYCGRHFAELLDIPRCSACDELIFVKEYTVAEGQAFHVKHFCCFECDDALGGKQYVPKDGQPICLPCYERKYGKTCQTCGSKIGAQGQRITWKSLHWHAKPDCFCCAACRKSLLGGRFAVEDQRPFCSKECMQSL